MTTKSRRRAKDRKWMSDVVDVMKQHDPMLDLVRSWADIGTGVGVIVFLRGRVIHGFAIGASTYAERLSKDMGAAFEKTFGEGNKVSATMPKFAQLTTSLSAGYLHLEKVRIMRTDGGDFVPFGPAALRIRLSDVEALMFGTPEPIPATK